MYVFITSPYCVVHVVTGFYYHFKRLNWTNDNEEKGSYGKATIVVLTSDRGPVTEYLHILLLVYTLLNSISPKNFLFYDYITDIFCTVFVELTF